MADNQIEFDIVAKLDGIDKSLKDVEKAAKATGDKVESSMGSGLSKRINTAFLGLASGVLAFKAIEKAAVAAFNTIGSAIKEAADEQKEINNLNQALISAGTFSEEASQKILDFANNIEKTTTISGGAATELVTLSRVFARTNEEAVKLTQAAIELSAATGMDLNAAAEQLGKTLSGQAGRLAQTVPALRGISQESLKAGAALDVVIARFSGSAASKVNTFEGSLLQLKNVFNGLLTAIGNIIVKSPGLTAAFKFIAGELIKLTGSVEEFATTSGDIIGVWLQRITKGLEVFIVTAKLTFQLLNKDVFAALKTATTEVPKLFEEDGKRSGEGFFAGLNNAIANAEPVTLAPQNGGVGGGFGDEQAAGFQELLNSNAMFIEENRVMFTQYIEDTGKLSKDQILAVAEFEMSTQDVLKSAFESAKKRIEQMKALSADLRMTFTSGVTTMFQNVGAALAKGQNVFGAFGKGILDIMGTLAIKVGANILAQSQALQVLAAAFTNPFLAPTGIAAGIALIVLGGALKAFAGGGGGGSTATGVPSEGGGGVAGSGTTSPIGENITALQETENQQPGTNVAVNINGNVLGDKRTLGIAVAEAINEAFGSDGVVVARGAIA